MDIYRWTDEQIRWRLSRRAWPGEIVGKEADGVGVTVKRLGFSATEGPYPTERGAWGALRVGDRCLIRTESPVPIVGQAIELTAPANQMQLVGEDKSVEETTSHTTWETLLEVDGLVIPEDAIAEVQFVAEVETVGSAGATSKQVSLVFNGTDAHDFNIGSATATAWIPCRISTYAAGLDSPARFMQLMTGTSTTVLSLPVDEITSVRVDARTNDTSQGNDIVRVTELLVFA